MKKVSLTYLLIIIAQLIGFQGKSYAALPIIFDAGTYGCPSGTSTYTKPINLSIGNTDHDSIYLAECYTTSSFSHVFSDTEILTGQTYTMYLHFAEIYHGTGNVNFAGGDGDRVFHVDIEGVRILDSLDIHKEVGPSNALIYRYDVLVEADGNIDISFISVIGEAKVSAIEIRQLNEASAFPSTTSVIDVSSPVLPLDLDFFTVSTFNENRAIINWAAAEEINLDGYEIQMAAEGFPFSRLDFVKGKGNNNYYYQTKPFGPGTYYFRLKQVDLNGIAQYSSPVEWTSKEFSEEILSAIYPNPSSSQSSVQLNPVSTQFVSIDLFSYKGEHIFSIHSGEIYAGENRRITFNTTSLPEGMYLIRVVGHTHYSQHKLIVKK